MNPYKKAVEAIPLRPDLLTRTAARMARKREPARIAPRFAAACAACCLLAAGLLPWYMPETARAPAVAAPASAVSGHQAPSSVLPSPEESGAPATPVAGQAVWNRVETVEARQILGCGPFMTHRETWTLAQYEEFLGFSPQPTILPEGLTFAGADSREMAFRDDALCNFYNTWCFTYEESAAPSSRRVHVYVNSDFIPYWNAPRAYELTDAVTQEDISALLRQGESSLLNGVEVMLWQAASGTGWQGGFAGYSGREYEFSDYLCADFSYKGAGFTVTAENGVTEAEFLALLGSLLS